MVVISDTSPLTALLLARREELLRDLFGRVVIPPSVQIELLRTHAKLPSWIEVIAPQMIPASVSDAGLDLGETEAIALACRGAIKPGHCAIKPGRVRTKVDGAGFAHLFRSRSEAEAEKKMRRQLALVMLQR